MKQYLIILSLIIGISAACNSSKNIVDYEKPKLVSDTLRIANKEVEYEVIIIDAGFTSWFNTSARPRNYYSQNYLEARNRVWILEWNRRAMMPLQYNPNLYEMQIDYDNSIDYGYEVNYLIYNYLVYFQLKNNQKLGGFLARI
ncbi:conserved hypothetical protein [Flavobacterium sp. 9AF]|uniref:DUF6146 family protein n=1 Tax=Flavobacterium sp. 9AF TaxID=2653142 RepID=UPI0012F2F251|nr:DUF6146 family protein [Flavobacterium sp. 9AF]VXC20350.1 conserved hypothetical protein [Flavobacterium sp. 9AF]